MANSKQIVYLSQAQYTELITNGSITVDGVTVNYDENDIYVTPQAEPVTDVMVAGTSVAANGIANIPYGAGLNTATAYGLQILSDSGSIRVVNPGNDEFKAGGRMGKPIAPGQQHYATFYGLAKAAGHDEKDSTEPFGTYTSEAKGAIQTMLGTNTMLAPDENDLVADRDYAIGDLFTSNGKVYKATAEILTGVAIVTSGNNANCEETTIADAFVKDVQVNGTSVLQNGVANVPIANTISKLGVVQVHPDYGLNVYSSGLLTIQGASINAIKGAANNARPITCANQHQSVFYALAKAAGDTTQSQSDNPVGSYTDSAKTAIKTMLGIEEGGSSGEVVTPIDDTAGVGDTAKVWSADKTSTEINNIIDTAPTEELAAELLMQEETNTYLNEKFLNSIHNMFESLPQDEILSEILEGLVDGNGLLRQLYHELEARKLAAE